MIRSMLSRSPGSIKSASNWAYWILACASICALVYAAWFQASLQLLHRFPFPYRDFVVVTEALDRLPILNPFTPWNGPTINEHRVIYPNSFYILDMLYFGATGNLLYFFIYVFTALSAVALILPVTLSLKHKPDAASNVLVAALFASGALYWFFSASNWENLTFQIQLCETGCVAFMVLGLLAASRVSIDSRDATTLIGDTFWATLAGIFCHIATFSWGAGLVTWPIVLAHAIFYRWRRTPLLVFSFIALLTVGIFSYWYLSDPTAWEGNNFHQSFASAVRKPTALLYFVVNVLVWPPSLAIGDLIPARIARLLAIGLCLPLILISLFAMGRSYWNRHSLAGNEVKTPTIFFTMLVAAAVCSAALMGIARSGAIVGWGQSRYGVFSALFWLGIFGWWICISERTVARGAVILVTLTLMMAFMPWKYYELDIRSREQGLYQAAALTTFGLDVRELPRLNGGEGVDPRDFIMWKKPRGDGPSFAEREPFGWFGRPITSVGISPAHSHCSGAVEATTSLKNSSKVYIVDGWASNGAGGTPLRWVLVVNKGGIVIGGGKPGLPSYDVARRLQNAEPEGTQDSGTANARFSVVAINDNAQQFSLWGVDGNGNRCEAATFAHRYDRSCDKNCGFDEWYGIGLPQKYS